MVSVEICEQGAPCTVVILGAGLSVFCADGLAVHTPMLFRSLVSGVPFREPEYWNKTQALCVPGIL